MRSKLRYDDDPRRQAIQNEADARADAAMTQALLGDQKADTTPRPDDESYVLWVIGGGHATDSWGR